MSDVGLFSHLGADVAIWLAVTCVLGGAGAFAAGRALALAWRPFGPAIAYAAGLAAGVAFLAYALFDVPVIPAARIIDRTMTGDYGEAAIALAGYAVTFCLLVLFAFTGWRLTRARQMRRQYPFLMAREER